MSEQPSPVTTKDGSMSIIDHLSELRIRIIRFIVVMGVMVLCCYFFRKEILDLIKEPVEIPLEKYSTQTMLESEGKTGVVELAGKYNCICEEVLSDQNGSKSTDTPAVGSTAQENTPVEPQNMWETAQQTVLDFVSYFQVMLGRAPTANPDYVSPDVQSTRQSLNKDNINLSCQCAIGGKKSNAHSSMVYIGLPELFFAQMKAAIFAGFFLAFPYLLIELWGFIGPALYKGERKVFWIFSIASYICFIGGSLFGYFIVFPFGFDFFLSLTQPGEIMPSLSIGEYLGLSIKLLLAFGFIFEMPLVTFILSRMGIITPELMLKQGRAAIIIIFLMSAFLTPPDPFTMFLMAGPLLFLYIVSIIVCFFGVNRKKVALRAKGLEEDDFE